MGEQLMAINLLPESTRGKIQFAGQLRSFARAWLVASLLVFALILSQAKALWQDHQRLAALEGNCVPLYALQAEIDGTEKKIRQMEARLVRLSQLQPDNHALDVLGLLTSAMRRANGALVVQRLNFQSEHVNTQVKGTPPAKSIYANAESSRKYTLTLSGVTDDDASFSRFVSGLRETAVFDRVELKSSSQTNGSDRLAKQYQLECRRDAVP
jgi:Tfp pilus assembly protein PilN